MPCTADAYEPNTPVLLSFSAPLFEYPEHQTDHTLLLFSKLNSCDDFSQGTQGTAIGDVEHADG